MSRSVVLTALLHCTYRCLDNGGKVGEVSEVGDGVLESCKDSTNK